MVWNATLSGNASVDEELAIARSLAEVSSTLGVHVSFWTSNTPVDMDALVEESLVSRLKLQAHAPATAEKAKKK